MVRVLTSVPGRIVRFLAGFLLVVAGAYFHPLIALALIALGSVLAVEALAGECILASLLGRRDDASAAAHAHPVR
jgi:hypothetical protein